MPVERELTPLLQALSTERKRQGLSQTDMDRRIGLADGLVSKWECGVRRPSLYLLACYAWALDGRLTYVPGTSSAPAPPLSMASASPRRRKRSATQSFDCSSAPVS